MTSSLCHHPSSGLYSSPKTHKASVVSVQQEDKILDMTGVACPMPLLKTKLTLKGLDAGQILKVIATDSGSWRDIPKFVGNSSHRLLEQREDAGEYLFWIERGEG